MSVSKDSNAPIVIDGVRFRPLTMRDIATLTRLIPIPPVEQSTFSIGDTLAWFSSAEGVETLLANRTDADTYAKIVAKWSIPKKVKAAAEIVSQALADPEDVDPDPTSADSRETGS